MEFDAHVWNLGEIAKDSSVSFVPMTCGEHSIRKLPIKSLSFRKPNNEPKSLTF